MFSHLTIASIALGLLAGCQTYEPSALDLAAHAAQWRGRSPGDEEVRTFSKRLGESDPGRPAFNPANGLSMREAEVVALVYNPDLRIARLRAGVVQATAEHAGRWDDPEFGIDLLKITESVPDSWIAGSSLSLTVPISGRLQVEKARAQAEMRTEVVRVAEAEWKVLHDLREVWLAWSADRLRLGETERIVDALNSIVASTSKLAEAGEVPQTEANLLNIERESRRAELAQLRGKVAEGEQQILGVLGLSPSAPVSLVPALSVVRVASDNARLNDSNPSLARLRGEYEVAEHTLLLEIRKQHPDLTIGPQAESDQGQSRIGLVGAIPLPILNSNKGGIAKARGEREVARAAYETEYERLTGRLASARARLRGAEAHHRTINQSLVPLVDQQVSDARRLVEIGEGGGLVLLESLARAHEAKLKLVDSQLESSRTSNEIRFLLGPENRESIPKNTK